MPFTSYLLPDITEVKNLCMSSLILIITWFFFLFGRGVELSFRWFCQPFALSWQYWGEARWQKASKFDSKLKKKEILKPSVYTCTHIFSYACMFKQVNRSMIGCRSTSSPLPHTTTTTAAAKKEGKRIKPKQWENWERKLWIVLLNDEGQIWHVLVQLFFAWSITEACWKCLFNYWYCRFLSQITMSLLLN